jgi:phage-related protein
MFKQVEKQASRAAKSTGGLTNYAVEVGGVKNAATKGLVERVRGTANEVRKAIKDSGKKGWEGIKKGLEKMQGGIVAIANKGDAYVENFANYLVKKLGWQTSPTNIAKMKAAIYATAGTAVAGGAVATGVAVHNKNKKNQSTQQPVTQPATQQPATQQPATQSGWQGLLYT